MPYYPDQGGTPATNVATEHVFRIRCTFAASSAVAYSSKDATIAKAATGRWTITLPQPYREITQFSAGWFRAAGATTLTMQLTDIADLSESTGTVEVSAVTPVGGTETDPSVGDVCYITIGVSSDFLNANYTGTG